jgi:hypothetical protein
MEREGNRERLTLCWSVPEGYFDLVKKIDEDFQGQIQKSANYVFRDFSISTFSKEARFPKLTWSPERGLVQIVLNKKGASVRMGIHDQYFFSDVHNLQEGLVLVNILSRYLNSLLDLRRIETKPSTNPT